MAKRKAKAGVVASSGNVFADLGMRIRTSDNCHPALSRPLNVSGEQAFALHQALIVESGNTLADVLHG